MTAGTKSYPSGVLQGTSCGTGAFTNGTQRTWSGADGPPLSAILGEKRERQLYRLLRPRTYPYGPYNRSAEELYRVIGQANAIAHREGKAGKLSGRSLAGFVAAKSTPHNYTVTFGRKREKLLTGVDTYVGGPPYPSKRVLRITGHVDNCGWLPTGFESKPWTPSDTYALIGRLRERIVGSDFNAGVALGAEGVDTVRFIANAANRVYRTGVAMRRGNVTQAFDMLRTWGVYNPKSRRLADLRRQEDVYRDILESLTDRQRREPWSKVPAHIWLEWHLAVEPLLGDTWAAAEMLAAMVHKPRQQKFRVSKTILRPVKKAVAGQMQWSGFERERRHILAMYQAQPNLAPLMGFDPEVVLWNALPLSFVADWFLNIGGYLEANATVRALPSGTYVYGTKVETFSNSPSVRSTSSWVTVLDGTNGEWVRSSGSYTRSVSTSPPVVEFPKFEPLGALASWKRAITGLALLQGANFRGYH